MRLLRFQRQRVVNAAQEPTCLLRGFELRHVLEGALALQAEPHVATLLQYLGYLAAVYPALFAMAILKYQEGHLIHPVPL